jgi:hypothetical protein
LTQRVTLWAVSPDRPLRTVYLGQFEHERAERIAEQLETARIAWAHKQFGRLTRLLFMGDWGVRLFVDSERIAEARAIVEQVSAEDQTR